MPPIALIFLAAVCFGTAIILEAIEQKSRLWHEDRAMLRGSGFFCGIGVVVLVMAFF